MTVVENLTPRVQYNYISEQQEYPITFPYIERQYVKCMVGDDLLTYNIDYQVPAFDQESLDENELYLTLLITPTVGDVITIYRETSLDQQAEFPQTARFSSQKITEALDKLTQQQQEQQDDINTCLRLAKNIPVDFNTELPEPAANQVIQWNEDGTQLINYDLRSEIQTIDTKANTAISTANTAESKADTAISTANTATTKANNAISTANDAVDTANTASTNASNAVTTANNAASTADTASTNASNAVSTANDASSTATNAKNKVDALEENIETVIEAAGKINELEEAVTTATNAATTASTAADTATQKAQEISQALNNMSTINDTSLLNGGNINLQVPLVSGTNIKTINSTSILGSGNIEITGGAGDIDNVTITTNTDDEIQTVAVIDDRSGDALKFWTGTKQQYDAILSKDNDTIYNVTDDSDNTNIITSLLETLYPVGAIYIGTMATCPLQTLGIGTWVLKAENRVLQGSGTNDAGDTVEAGLPNITGSIKNCMVYYSSQISSLGALYTSTRSGTKLAGATSSSVTSENDLYINASRSSSIYGNSNTVQPPAYIVNIWERVL